MNSLKVFFLLCFVFYTPSLSAFYSGEVILFVDPNSGNDSNNGSVDKPFKSLQKVKDYIRTINTNMSRDILVNLRGGEYQLTEGLIFEAKDSGNNGFKIRYKSFNEEKAVITGGRKISGWTPVAGKNYWVADVPISAGYASYFRNIWVNGNRAVQARSGFITFHAMNYE
jgi:hypothetical protein